MIPAILEGWHREWREAYPTLKRGGRTQGALVRMSARGLGRLAAYEGDQYRLVPATVRAHGRSLRCRLWVK